MGRRVQLSGRVDQCVLRWVGHVKRMDEEFMTKKVMTTDVEGNMWRGRPRLGWMNGVRMALGERDMSVEQNRLNMYVLASCKGVYTSSCAGWVLSEM